MIQAKIDKLIPYLQENFLTYPLLEEGKFIPFVNIWLPNEKWTDYLIKRIKGAGYTVDSEEHGRNITYLSINPTFKDLKDGDYTFLKKDWSIEEMIDICIEIVS